MEHAPLRARHPCARDKRRQDPASREEALDSANDVRELKYATTRNATRTTINSVLYGRSSTALTLYFVFKIFFLLTAFILQFSCSLFLKAGR